jgi:hypothetical protein
MFWDSIAKPELLRQQRVAKYQAERMGFYALPSAEVQGLLAQAEKLMVEAGFAIDEKAKCVLPVVMTTGSVDAVRYLEERRAGGVYQMGVCLIKDPSQTDVVIHELVHHLQGCWTKGPQVDACHEGEHDKKYKARWTEGQAHLVMFAVRYGKHASHWLPKAKCMLEGFFTFQPKA